MLADKPRQVTDTSLMLMCDTHAAVTVCTSLFRRKVRTRSHLLVLAAVSQTNQCVAGTQLAPRPCSRHDLSREIGKESDHLVACTVKAAERVVVP